MELPSRMIKYIADYIRYELEDGCTIHDINEDLVQEAVQAYNEIMPQKKER